MLPPATLASLALLRLPDTGAARYWQLINAFGSAPNVLKQPSDRLQAYLSPAALAMLRTYQQQPHTSPLALQLAADCTYVNNQTNLCCLGTDDDAYPQLLREIPKPPPVLFVRGDPSLLSLPQIAIIGSRNPSAGGRDNARDFAAFLARSGFAITSGLALGVDAAAHLGALKANGTTLAVMGTGIDLVYPARHQALAQQIVDAGGALISEFPLGTRSHAANFPQRNRIISGLSCGTLVVEAALKSGSLITAAYALQHNREVFAIPGSIHNPLARGCHQLIRQGATLVETAQDIVAQLGAMLAFKSTELATLQAHAQSAATASTQEPLTAAEQALLNALGFDPVTLEQLLERTAMDIGALASALMLLEIKGLISQASGTYQRL